MTSPREAAFHVEAKLHAFRKTQDGVVVSFVVSPIDMPQALALDPLGTRYMLALAQIGDDEQPVSPVSDPPAAAPSRSDQGKERYAASSEAEKALVRAARLPKDERFRAWVAKEMGWGDCSDGDAIGYIRDACCNHGSRREIAEERDCYQRFIQMETAYLIWAGVLSEPR